MSLGYDEIERAMQREFERRYDIYDYEFTEGEVERVREMIRDGEPLEESVAAVCADIAETDEYDSNYLDDLIF
jgi:hypothetical protein